MLIIIGLMVVFLGKMNADNVVSLLNEYGGVRDTVADQANAEQLVMMWTLAGIVVVNSITITLMMVGIMVDDEERKRLSSFYVSPVNRSVFVLGYIIAAIVMGVIMCTLTVIIGEVYIAVTVGTVISVIQMGKTFLYIVLNVFTSASMVFLIANFVHSVSAFSGLSTILGTLVGFLAAIYLPMGMLPEKLQDVLKCFPLVHGCSLMREIFTEEIVNKTFVDCPEALIDGYKKYMGISLYFGDALVTDANKVVILVISGIIFIGIAAVLQGRRNVMSR
jgi:multidrug/hemolysin transport system permease protein